MKLLKIQTAFIIAVIITALYLMISSLNYTGFTVDEYNYYQNGKDLVTNFRWDTQLIRNHPPLTFYVHGLVSYLNLSKGSLATELNYERIGMMIFFVALAISMYFLSKKYFGWLAAVLALILCCFNIEILAHSRLITPDSAITLFIFLTVIFLEEFFVKPTVRNGLLLSVFLGLALLSKYTALMLYPISLFLGLIYITFFSKFKKITIFSRLLIVFLLAAFVVNFGYGFSGSLQLPENYLSKSMQKMNSNVFTANLLRIFPKPYLQGVDWQMNESQKPWMAGNFFRGKYSNFGFKDFFCLTFVFKTQTSLLILILLNLYLIFFRKKPRFLNFSVLFTAIFYLIYFSLFSNLNIGFRYLLPIYPLLILWVSQIINLKFKTEKLQRGFYFLLVLLVFWYVLAAVKIHPYYLAYANEFVGGPKNSWKLWADSTVDWAQDNSHAAVYLKKYQQIQLNPRHPMEGLMAVSINDMNMYYFNDYQWLRKLDKDPVETIGYTWLIFDITRNDYQKITQTTD